MIKKIIILLTISNFIYSQERVDEILTKIDKTILTSISKRMVISKQIMVNGYQSLIEFLLS